MEELLRAPTESYGEAIVLPEINADHFEIKTNLLQLVQANPFHGLENENPHAHINSFKRITSTLRFRNVPNDVIKLMMFPYSLEGAAKTKVIGFQLLLGPNCNTPKMGRSGNDVPGALLHNTIAQVMRERPLTGSFEK
ncbi:hypothetical protein Tco_0345349 [Tanacetum coccineum]